MTGPTTRSAAREPKPRIGAAQVADWLREHPDFLRANPELMSALLPPDRGSDTVVDFQRFMLENLQARIGKLSSQQKELVGAARDNVARQDMIHRAVLLLLEATTFEHLIHITTQDLVEILEVDVITICVEAENAPITRVSTVGVHVLKPGELDRIMGSPAEVLLRQKASHAETLFGPAAPLVRSDALARLNFGAFAPAGLIAFGSRDEGHFRPGQGTDLIQFLAGVVQRCVRAWLDLPPGR